MQNSLKPSLNKKHFLSIKVNTIVLTLLKFIRKYGIHAKALFSNPGYNNNKNKVIEEASLNCLVIVKNVGTWHY